MGTAEFDLREILNRLFAGDALSAEEACAVLKEIAGGRCSDAQIASFLTVYRMRAVSVEEMEGFRAAMLELCRSVDVADFKPIDIVGTGGDGKNTFNISTLSALVVAGTGQKVAKHGNYSASSVCGSSNVLEQVGVSFGQSEQEVRASLERSGICFLHAPLFHPAMKNVAPVRKALGVRTFFNLLGPIANPASPPYQMIGVCAFDLLRLYAYVLQKTEIEFMLVYSLCGYDEISLTGPFKIVSRSEERLFEPRDLGLERIAAEELAAGESVEEAADLFVRILEGKGTRAQQDVVAVNAGAALHCAEGRESLSACIAKARESLQSGSALKVLQSLQQEGK